MRRTCVTGKLLLWSESKRVKDESGDKDNYELVCLKIGESKGDSLISRIWRNKARSRS